MEGRDKKLEEIADELILLSNHIKEYLAGEHPTLPMQWDIQEVYEKYRATVSPNNAQD